MIFVEHLKLLLLYIIKSEILMFLQNQAGKPSFDKSKRDTKVAQNSKQNKNESKRYRS